MGRSIWKTGCFVHAPRYTNDRVCFVSNNLDLGECKTIMMNKNQRKEIVSGVQVTKQQDITLAASLDSSRPISKRPILARVASALAACCAGAISSVFEVGQNAATRVVDGRFTGQVEDKYLQERPALVLSYLGQDARESSVDHKYFETSQAFADAGSTVLHIDSQFNANRWEARPLDMPISHCRGDLSFAANDPGIVQDLQVLS